MQPQPWPWALAAVAANHAFLEAARARGEIAITFDDGPDAEVTPQVLDLLDARGGNGRPTGRRRRTRARSAAST